MPVLERKSFTYRTSLDGVRGRSAVLHSGGRPSLEVSAPLEFKGDPSLWSPEDFFVAAFFAGDFLAEAFFAEDFFALPAAFLVAIHRSSFRFSPVYAGRSSFRTGTCTRALSSPGREAP